MLLNISFEKYNLSTKITTPFSIKDILANVKSTLNIKEINFLVVDEQNEILSETEVLLPSGEPKNLYLLRNTEHPEPVQIKNEKEPSIEEMIMQVTGASEKIVVKKQEIKAPFDFFEQLSNGNNSLSRLLSVLQGLEERNNELRGFEMRAQHNVEPNENYVRELKDMGFPEDRARAALIRTRNDVTRATDILLSGEDVGDSNNNPNPSTNHNDNEDDNNEDQ